MQKKGKKPAARKRSKKQVGLFNKGFYIVDGYGIRVWSSRSTTNLNPSSAVAGIHFYQGSVCRGYAYFFPDGTPLPAPIYDMAYGQILLYYNLCQFHAIMEMIKTEKPLMLYYDGPHNAALRCGIEPVGEEEK